MFNEEKYLGLCLGRLTEVDYPDDKFEIIVVDNGSTDRSVSIAKSYTNKVFILPDVNVGAVRNFGVRQAQGDLLAFLDADCLVDKDWLNNGVKLLTRSEKQVYGGVFYLRENPYWIEKYWLLGAYTKTGMQNDLAGGCIFIRKADFEKSGRFAEDVSSGEDSALSHSLEILGYTIKIEKKIGVVHLGNPITVKDFISRQIWHSENYFLKLSESLKDKIFWLSVVFLISLVLLIVSIITDMNYILDFAAFVIFSPAILSVKRSVRASFLPRNFNDLTSIYVIDFFYLVGRSLGILKSIYLRLVSKK